MDWKFVVALLFALIVAVFAIQNAEAVEVSFLTFEMSMSQALVILISAAFGALAVLMLSLIRWIKYKAKIIGSTKSINSLEQENKKLKMKLEECKAKNEAVSEASGNPNGNIPH